LKAQDDESLLFFTSKPLLAELTNVLGRRKFANKIRGSGFTMRQLVDLYLSQSRLVEPYPIPRTAPDVDDDMVIGTALAARADAIVTGDRGLLSLGTYAGGRIISVADALKMVFPG
jgi:putative PIN family toxin of toxin-antitoxin system